jgi:heat shock protein HslJ
VKRAALLLVAAVVLAGCPADPIGVAGPSAVQGQTWRLISLERNGQAVVAVSNPDRYTLAFDEGQRLGVRSDCNQCGGAYELRDGAFSVGPLACTKAFCGDSSLDADYSAMLGAARTLETYSGRLIVGSDRGTLRFTR